MGRGRTGGLQDSRAGPTPCLDTFPNDNTLGHAELDLSGEMSRRTPSRGMANSRRNS